MWSKVKSGEWNSALLYINNKGVEESRHGTSSENGLVRSTGGREIKREFSQGDNIELRAPKMDGEYWYIHYCAEYVPKLQGTVFGNKVSSQQFILVIYF